MLKCFLGIGCINTKSKVNEMVLNAPVQKQSPYVQIIEMFLQEYLYIDKLPTFSADIHLGTWVHNQTLKDLSTSETIFHSHFIFISERKM